MNHLVTQNLLYYYVFQLENTNVFLEIIFNNYNNYIIKHVIKFRVI